MASELRIFCAQMATPRRTRKVATNLSLRGDLVRRAKKLGLKLSAVVDAALEQAVKQAEAKAWLDENRDAIVEYNALVAKRGVFSAGRRRF
jgi:antitoxin CcdA